MRRRLLIGCAFVWVAGLIGVSGPAGAAPLLSISYDVGAPVSPPPGALSIIGGSVAVTLPGLTSTPVNCAANCGTANIVLTATYGPLPWNAAPVNLLNVTPNNVQAQFTYMYVYAGYTYQSFGYFNYTKTVMGGNGYGKITGYRTLTPSITFSAPFQIGNEIRLPTPPPTPTPTPVTPTPATPTPPPAAGAMFRVLRGLHGHEAPGFTSSFTLSYSEPRPGMTVGGSPSSPAYPPALATFTAAGGFTIPRQVIHFGYAASDSYTFQCGTLPTMPDCRPGYPVSTYNYAYYNYKGFFQPNNPNAALAPTTIKRTATSTSFTTTLFSNRYALGRVGSIKITPGPKRFGGTMRYFGGLNAEWYHLNSLISPCCERGYGHNFRTASGSLGFTENSPQVIGGTHPAIQLTRTHTTLTTGSGTPNNPGPLITRMVQYIRTTAPWTTGRVSVFQSGNPYTTTIVKTGSDNRTPAGAMGTLSLVVPWLTHHYATDYNPSDPATSPVHWAGIQTMRVNFLPEPGGLLLLGAGVLGLVGVYRFRRR